MPIGVTNVTNVTNGDDDNDNDNSDNDGPMTNGKSFSKVLQDQVSRLGIGDDTDDDVVGGDNYDDDHSRCSTSPPQRG